MGKSPPSIRPKIRSSSTKAPASGTTGRTYSAPPTELSGLLAQLSLASDMKGRTDSVPSSELSTLLEQLSLVASQAPGSQSPQASNFTILSRKGSAAESPVNSSRRHTVPLKATSAERDRADSTHSAPGTPSTPPTKRVSWDRPSPYPTPFHPYRPLLASFSLFSSTNALDFELTRQLNTLARQSQDLTDRILAAMDAGDYEKVVQLHRSLFNIVCEVQRCQNLKIPPIMGKEAARKQPCSQQLNSLPREK